MSLNTEMVNRLAAELADILKDGRIEKIHQPEKDLLLFSIRNNSGNRKLLIRSGGPNTRMHLTACSYENPPAAPMFCMLLRKYLKSAKILDIRQVNDDRIIVMTVESRTELGDEQQLQLVVELLGRAANVLLISEDGHILDCLRRIPPSETSRRALLPGLRYDFPDKPPAAPIGRTDAVQFPTDRSISTVLDEKYSCLEQNELRRRRAQELSKTVRRARDRQQRKLSAQAEEYRQTENMEQVRREAELLKANLYRVQKGDRRLECENYFEPDCPAVSLSLDPMKTPQENLKNRFRAYRKLKGAREHLSSLIADGARQLDYLNSVLDELNRAETQQDLEEIRQELEGTGILKASRDRKKTKMQRPSAPFRFESPDGFEILVGRNNKMNDDLTTREARRTDYWLHVKDLHGSHVILRCEGRDPTDTALKTAAELAARFSQASGKCAVDYTMVRNVKKPSGAMPGRVVYQNYRTMIVDTGEQEEET